MIKPMRRKLNSFAKVAILVFGLLLLMMLFFAIYNRVTVQVMKSEIESANLNKLLFLKNQLEEKINQISINSITLANDPAIRELEFLQQSGDPYDRQKLTRMILENISLQSGITGWWTDITVYSRLTREVVSTTSDTFGYNDEELIASIRRGWQFQKGEDGDPGRFVWYSVAPTSSYEDLATARLVVKTSFSGEYLQDVLDQFKSTGQGDPLLYSPEFGMIGNRTIDEAYAKDVLRYLDSEALGEGRTNLSLQLSDERYLMSFLPMYGVNWYLVDSIPVGKMLSPVTKARNLFYAFSLALLAFGSLAAYILYRQLQVPIRELVKNMQSIKRGNYGSRIQMEGSSEFTFLFQRFNEMAEEIQMLLERVYEEKIRSREALLKQLQSQINPHFLYNCLFYIKNMARLGDEEAVVAMALNLGEYFRYTTRLGKQTAQLREELDVIVNYLEIQNLRTNRIAFRIDVEERLKSAEFPRLILQPIVENAVIHGIEPKDGKGMISIESETDESGFLLRIEDNGIGMDEARLEALQKRLEQPDNQDNVSFGLWNVNQRLKLMFGDTSGLRVGRSEGGGTIVSIVVRGKGEDRHVQPIDR